jgi:hypothetical protein
MGEGSDDDGREAWPAPAPGPSRSASVWPATATAFSPASDSPGAAAADDTGNLPGSPAAASSSPTKCPACCSQSRLRQPRSASSLTAPEYRRPLVRQLTAENLRTLSALSTPAHPNQRSGLRSLAGSSRTSHGPSRLRPPVHPADVPLTQDQAFHLNTVRHLISLWEVERYRRSKGLLPSSKLRPSTAAPPRRAAPKPPSKIFEAVRDFEAAERRQVARHTRTADAWTRSTHDPPTPRALVLARERGHVAQFVSSRHDEQARAHRRPPPAPVERALTRSYNDKVRAIQGEGTPLHVRLTASPAYAHMSAGSQRRLRQLVNSTGQAMAPVGSLRDMR